MDESISSVKDHRRSRPLPTPKKDRPQAKGAKGPESVQQPLLHEPEPDHRHDGPVDVGMQRGLGVSKIPVGHGAIHHRPGGEAIETFIGIEITIKDQEIDQAGLADQQGQHNQADRRPSLPGLTGSSGLHS